MIILRYSTSLQLKNHRSYDKNIKRVIFQSFQILSIFFRHVTWTSLLKCLIIWKEKFFKPISMDEIAYCNQLLFILVKKLISSHEIKRNTSVNGKCLLFFYSDFICALRFRQIERRYTLLFLQKRHSCNQLSSLHKQGLQNPPMRLHSTSAQLDWVTLFFGCLSKFLL